MKYFNSRKMKVYLAIFLISSISYFSQAKEVCYGDLGCFNNNYPFGGTLERPIAVLPQSPEKVGVKFTLYKRGSSAGAVITVTSQGAYDPLLKTKFIIHGFLHNANKKWVLDIKDAMLRVENLNVITVDWSKGNGFPYDQATANSQIVGAEIAKLINTMISTKNAKAVDFHLIGHSLGSHISGYAGSRVPGLGRITGLDPAGPSYEFTPPIVRLDPTDAVFVDTIHSDGSANLKLGLGLMQPLGHADFYPNGGKNQPGCGGTSDKLLGAIFNLATFNVEGAEDSLSCSHSAAYHFFLDTIESNKCQYNAYPCKKKEDFDNGLCIKCSAKGCNRMGYWASPSSDNGMLFLSTESPSKTNYCNQHFLVNLVSNKINNLSQARGKLTVTFKTSKELSAPILFDDSNISFKPDSTESRLLSLEKTIDNTVTIDSVFVSYTKTTNIFIGWLYENQWSFRYVEIFNGETQTTLRYCPLVTLIQSGQSVEFKKC